MPKDTSRAPLAGPGRHTCARCGARTELSRNEHYRQVHQAECTLLFRGEAHRVPVGRGADALWRCPRCAMAFAGSARTIQEHAKKGLCEGERSEDDEEDEDEDEDDWESEEMHHTTEDHNGEESGRDSLSTPSLTPSFSDNAFDMNIETSHELASLLAAGIGFQGEELAGVVEWTTRRPERATGKTTVPEATMALGALMYPTSPEPSEGFDSDNLSHPPADVNLEWSAPLRPSGSAKQPKSSSRTKSKSKASKGGRLSQHLGAPAASIQKTHAQVPGQGFAKSTPQQGRAQLNQQQLSEQTGVSPARTRAAARQSQANVDLDASPELATSPDLKAFFATARIPLDHLTPIFVARGYVTAADLDTICEAPEFWEEMKDDIVAKGKLVS